jgi:hypothetical protein
MPESARKRTPLAALQSQPGIDLRRLRPDTYLLVEAGPYIYEIAPINPADGLVAIASSHPRLRVATVCQYLNGIYALDESLRLPDRIGKDLRMQLRFRNGIFLSAPVVSARVVGKGWHFDVF